MRNDSLNLFPSLGSLSELQRDCAVPPNEMRLIMSRNNFNSFRSIEDDANVKVRHVDRNEQASIEHFQQQIGEQAEKDNLAVTIQSFKTPRKKKKTGCVCKKTGCLKLYCECFASGKMCTEQCSCCNCSNVHENNQQVENVRSARKSRHRQAPEKRACNCKKTQCLKKYCECFNMGVACGPDCKCNGCCNTEQHAHHKNIPEEDQQDEK